MAHALSLHRRYMLRVQMCAKLRQPVLVCVRRVSGGQPGLAPSRSWLASCQTPRLLPTKNAFAALAAKRGGVPATPSTGGWKDLTENCCPFSSLSPRRLHATRPPSSSDAVASPVSQREATSGVPASLVSDPPDSSISRSRSSSSGNGGSSKESRSNSSNSESSGSGSKSECREGAIGGRDETAEVQRLLRERHQRQADVIPFKIRRTGSSLPSLPLTDALKTTYTIDSSSLSQRQQKQRIAAAAVRSSSQKQQQPADAAAAATTTAAYSIISRQLQHQQVEAAAR
ncbi:hypothetical protein ACSSS7_005457 [Eimeria intestinalis]